MSRFLVLFSVLVAYVYCYQTMNSPLTAFSSCQDVLVKDPMAADGYYYINNYDSVEPYLTLCIMSVNGGGWTLFYKNSADSEEGPSYASMLEAAVGFLSEDSDFSDTEVVGVSPHLGLNPISLMAMVVGDSEKKFSAVYFENEDVAESVIDLSDLIVGCNTYNQQFKLVETYFLSRSHLTSSGKEDFTFSQFGYNNGTINFRSCEIDGDVAASDAWLGDVHSTGPNRVLSCGGLEGTHCAYFLRESSLPGGVSIVEVNLDGPGDECMCRAAGGNNMVWPATRCGETRVISCFDDADEGMLTRTCGADGRWSDYIQGNCTCAETLEFDTTWPATGGGETAHVKCVNSDVRTRDRLCLMNGEWDDAMTGGCWCVAGEFRSIQWEETEGGREAEHVCDYGAVGESYHRFCGVDGGWSAEVTGSCRCPEVEEEGETWFEAEPLTTQQVTCSPNSVGTSMNRTCSIYGSWERIQGNCDCPEEEVDGVLWPQTAAGITAYVSCAADAIGTPSTRVCMPGGSWGPIHEGSCSCPEEDWTNYAGTHYQFIETPAGSTVIMDCAKGIEGSISRVCGLFGVWEEPQGCHEDVYCPEETVGVLHFNETLGGTTVMYMCHGNSSMSYGRLCGVNGVWSDVIGYCECPYEEDEQGNEWPVTRGNETYSQQCDEGYKGTVSRSCSFFGEWVEIENTCERYMCPAEELDGVQWPETPSLQSVVIPCNQTGEGLRRFCNAMGQWETVTGGCTCASEEVDGYVYPETQGGETATVNCSMEGYMGVMLRTCTMLGVWEAPENNCHQLSCKGEVFESISWPDTPVGTTARVNCSSSSEGYNERSCSINGEWSSVISGPGCWCDMTTVEVNGQTYVFNSKKYDENPEIIGCGPLYDGTISYMCQRSGAWSDLDVQCTRVHCAYETFNGLSFPETDSNTTRHLPCDSGAVGEGYYRFCTQSGQWEDYYTGSCSCPEDELRHTDGHLYNFAQTVGGEVVSQVCAGDLAGSVSRTCSLFGTWQALRGECTQLQCPEEVYQNYHWPLTNSSTLRSFPCSNYQTGSVTRMCHASGVWEEPVFNCQEKVCQNVTITTYDGGIIKLVFDVSLDTNLDVTIVPYSSEEIKILTHGRVVQISGLKPNVAYSLFVSYCSDPSLTECTDSCMLSNIYYRQTCDTMQPPDVVDIRENASDRTIEFSSRFPTCPGEAQKLEVKMKCTEQCGSMDTEIVRTFDCSSLGGCIAGERAEFSLTGEFPTNALFEVQQRLLYSADSVDLTPFSSLRAFRIRDLMRPNYLTPTLEYINSQMVRLYLGDIAMGSVAYSKHEIYIYKKLTGTRRRLVDSLFSIVKLCPLGNTVCDETYTDVVVEPGYTFSFSIYSYMMVGNRKTVSVASIDVALLPPFSMTVTPGDYFILVSLGNALYPLSGTCSFISQKLASQKLVSVELPKLESIDVVATGLWPNSEYTVTCALHDELGLENRQTFTVMTKEVFLPTLSLTLISNTNYDVNVRALVNKPVALYCKVSDLQTIPSKEELKIYGTYFNVQTLTGFDVSLQLLTTYDSAYRVTCVAEDTNGNSALETLEVTSKPEEFKPELISRYPELDAVNVAPMVAMRLTFKYPVVVNNCTSCFFMLHNMKQHTTTNIYAPYFSVNGSSILFNTRQLDSLTEYRLEASTYKLIEDAYTGVLFTPEEDYLLRFTIREYVPIDGDIVWPNATAPFPVNGTIRVEFPTSYLFLNEGSVSLNALSIAADDQCLQILHPDASSTVLLIPVEDCVGILRADTSYVLSFPEGFLRARDYMRTNRMTRVFQTENKSLPPRMVDSFPPHLEEVPMDVPIKLYFNQPVLPGDGFLFVSEYSNDQYTNSYNLPASKASFGGSFPYEVAWSASLFSLKPSHRYVVSWSQGLVTSASGLEIAASTAAETVEFWTDVSGCSADFIAERISGTFQCLYEDGKCVCREWNVEAMTQKKY